MTSRLSEFYQQRVGYPRALSELPLQALQWGDEGSSARDLASWQYTSDGQSFTMNWQGQRGLVLFLGGKSGQIYYSEDEKRQTTK